MNQGNKMSACKLASASSGYGPVWDFRDHGDVSLGSVKTGRL